jgi:hypothetical protein
MVRHVTRDATTPSAPCLPGWPPVESEWNCVDDLAGRHEAYGVGCKRFAPGIGNVLGTNRRESQLRIRRLYTLSVEPDTSGHMRAVCVMESANIVIQPLDRAPGLSTSFDVAVKHQLTCDGCWPAKRRSKIVVHLDSQ